jgi:hypothetical protein
MACELNVGSRPVSPNTSRWLTTVTPPCSVSSQAGTWLSVTRKMRRTHGAKQCSARIEYRSSSRDANRELLAVWAFTPVTQSFSPRARALRSSQAGSEPSTQV